MAFVFNPLTGKLDRIRDIPELSSDPTTPAQQDAWILKTAAGGGSGGGKLKTCLGFGGGGGYLVTPTTGMTSTYQFSYRTLENTTKRVSLT